MTEPSDLSDLPEALAAPRRGWAPPLVWSIPIVAALIGGWLAVQAILERGPTIAIHFKAAEGIEAGKTKIKYKNVDIGEVTEIVLSEDRASIVATAQLSRQAEGFLVEDTRFWVVRPRVAGSGVSGIGTLISGSYIGVDIGRSTQARRDFVGLETPPVVTGDLPGRQFFLRGAELGSLDLGSPVYFRRFQVGRVVGFELDPDGKGVGLQLFVDAPYDRYVNADTRFWHASGIDLTLDATGVRVDTESLATIVLGGVVFESPSDSEGAPPAERDAVFTLHADRVQAMRPPDPPAERYLLVFNESVRGLSPGAPVDFRGVVIGEVTSIGVDLDAAEREVRMPVKVKLYPERLRPRTLRGRPEGAAFDSRALIERLVEIGFRAQLRTGNLLTGQLYIALDVFSNAAPVRLAWDKRPPELPTMPSSLEGLQATLEEIKAKLKQVPFEAIGVDLRKALTTLDRTLNNTDRLVRRLEVELAPEARATLAEARRTLGAAEQTLSAEAPVQQELRETLRELARAAAALRTLADYLERHPESLIRGKGEEKL